MSSRPIHAPIDEHALAALLSGTLDDREREGVLALLASDPEARIVLQMAIEALESVRTADPGREARVATGRRAA